MGSLSYNIGLAKTTEARSFTFKDISVPISKDETNYDLSQNLDLNAIKQAIRNIIDWTPGERILKPEFGNVLLEYLYEPINPKTAAQISSSLLSSLEIWEPRIKVTVVNVVPSEDTNEYFVEIVYEIPSLAVTAQKYTAILSN
jgi:phage baseplate assembly protein W